MGNAMIKPLKTKSEYLIEALGDKLTSDFENNKKIIKTLKLPLSKSTINKISGYILRCKKIKKKIN